MSTDTSKVTRVVNAFADAWNQHDMEAFAQLFAADAEFVNVVGLWWKGRGGDQAITRGHSREHVQEQSSDHSRYISAFPVASARHCALTMAP